MKKIIVLSFLFIAATLGFGQSSSQNSEMLELQRASRNPLLNGHSEIILVGNTSWERLFGESEFVLTPTVTDMVAYNNQIKELAAEMGDKELMRFGFFNLNLTNEMKLALVDCGIRIPDYYNLEVIKIMIPHCHFKFLQSKGALIHEDFQYGVENYSSNDEQAEVTFYSQGFEQANYPLSVSNTGSANCGWGRENCGYYTGNWSIWCSNTGGGCENCNGGEYVNDITTFIQPTNFIDVSSYSGRKMSYAIWSDVNDAEVIDYTALFYALNGQSQFTLSTAVYYSNSSIDEIGWTIRELLFTTPNINTFKYGFQFYSDGSWRSYGVYLDDIKISGTLITDIEEEVSIGNIIYPNPSADNINLKLNEAPERVEILDLNGRIVFASNFQRQIDVSTLSAGLYTIRAFLNSDVITEKFIKE